MIEVTWEAAALFVIGSCVAIVASYFLGHETGWITGYRARESQEKHNSDRVRNTWVDLQMAKERR